MVVFCNYQHKESCRIFWHVENGKMILNQLGKIVEEEWIRTKVIRTGVDLDSFVIMPNHLHGIIIINGTEVKTHRVRLKATGLTNGDACDASLRNIKNSLSHIVGGFKSAATKRKRTLAIAILHGNHAFMTA